jgi:hypothetical protein
VGTALALIIEYTTPLLSYRTSSRRVLELGKELGASPKLYSVSFYRVSMLMNNRPVGGHSPEAHHHPIDMNDNNHYNTTCRHNADDHDLRL